MKAKVFLNLSAGIVLFLLGGFVMSQMVDAQQNVPPFPTENKNTIWPMQDGDWNFWTNSPNMYSIPEGDVGIGTANPLAKLSVVNPDGDAVFGSSINGFAGYFDGNTRITGDLMVDGDFQSPNTGHVIVNWSGNTEAESVGWNKRGLYIGKSLFPDHDYEYCYYGRTCDSEYGSWLPYVITWKWLKTVDVTTLTYYLTGWIDPNTPTVNYKVNVGSAYSISQINSNTPIEVNNTIDVSNLTNGTVYDIVIEVRHTGSSSQYGTYMSKFALFGN